MVQEFLAATVGSIMMFGASATASLKNDRPPKVKNATSTTRTLSSADVACVGAAVAARESALGAGIATLNSEIAAAYAARASALATAYGGTNPKVVKEAVKSAWDTFKASKRVSSKNWKTAKDAAWKNFRSAVKECRGAAEVSDSSNSSSEASSE